MPTATTVEVPRDWRERVAWLHEFLEDWEPSRNNWLGDIRMAAGEQDLPPQLQQWLTTHPHLRYIDRIFINRLGDIFVISTNGLMPRCGQVKTNADLQAADPSIRWPQQCYAVHHAQEEVLVLRPQ